MLIALLGGNGRTGREVVAQALARGHEVRALVRNAAAVDLCSPGLEIVEGDARAPDDVARTARGAGALVSTLGSHSGKLGPLYAQAARAIVEAMNAEGVGRAIVLSSRSLGKDAIGDPSATKASGSDVLEDLREMERVLRASDLDITVMRPSRLVSEAGGEYETLTSRLFPPGRKTRRADLASAILDALETGRWLRDDVAIVSR